MTDIEALQNDLEQLKRYINILSYSGMGIDSSLDTALKSLRNSLKNDGSVDALKADIDRITQVLRELEETVETKAESRHSLHQLAPLLDEVMRFAGAPAKKQIQQLQDRLVQISPEDFAKELSAILNRLMQQESANPSQATASTKPTTEKKSWWPFGKKKAEDATAPTAVSLSGLPEFLLSALHNFVDQLSTVEIYQQASRSLKDSVNGLSQLEQLTSFIEQIATVLLEAANQEHVQFENFLQKLNKRLLSVASFLTTAAKHNDGVMSDTKSLEKAITDSVNEIKKEIEETPALGPLKQRLLSSFEHIFNSVGHFKDAQRQRLELSDSELKLVKEQLQVTEEEASRLRDNLKEQRFRAYNDPLTQLPNRYAYNERLSQEYSRWRRYRSPLSLILADVDHFKKVNDTYGHQAGDQVLLQVAEQLMQGVRESDFIARFGGEEFVILMPETSLTDATKAINKLRMQLSKTPIAIDSQQSISITVSFGVAEFEGTDTSSMVFAKADKALYRAKEKGRNQVCAERNGQFE